MRFRRIGKERHREREVAVPLQEVRLQLQGRRRPDKRARCGQKGNVHPALLNGKRLIQDAGAHVRQEPLTDIPLGKGIRRGTAGARSARLY